MVRSVFDHLASGESEQPGLTALRTTGNKPPIPEKARKEANFTLPLNGISQRVDVDAFGLVDAKRSQFHGAERGTRVPTR